MKDIDFDELDRAVNSLMNSAPQDDDDDATTVQSRDDTDSDVPIMADKNASLQDMNDEIQLAPPSELMIIDEPEEDDFERKETEKEREEDKNPHIHITPSSPVASLPTVRRGRFMDMVRSSPARETVKPAPSVMPSRQAPTLQPVTSLRPVAPVEKVAEPQFNAGSMMPGWTIEPPTQKAPDPAVTMQPMQTVEPVTTPSMDSPVMPFLPDAKVEKRPLGRPAEIPAAPVSAQTPEPALAPTMDPFTNLEPQNSEPVTLVNEDEDAQLPGQPLPAELNSELLSIETSTDMLPDSPSPVVPTRPVQPASHSLHIPGVSRPMAATSISQQYTVPPKNEETHETAGAIYDTASYHQPLMHPAKKKPGWLWVIAIIIILLLGAAGGAAVYYFGLGS